MIGDAKTGKTCAHFAFAKGSYPELFRPAIFSNYIADVKLDGKDVELELEDTSAHDDYDRLRPLSYPGTHVFMIAFAVDRPDSLEGACSRWVSEVTHHCPEVPVLLVGLKEDLRCDPERVRELVKTGQKPVAYHQGLAAARYIGAAAYVECSAKRGQGLASAFEAATRLALDGRDGVDKAGLLRHRGDGRCSVM
jgi:small GTP-binding protein